ncbi:MAG TPA: hypothetical protein VNT26_18185 [Candidatus Sulfotelmatobacter sp.]|nr:hypothetical protein [Candidatus Sulfotelmatobacter sp.]
MNQNKVSWLFLAPVLLLALALVLPAVPRLKAQPQRIQTVNHLARVSLTLPGTNAPPAANSTN